MGSEKGFAPAKRSLGQNFLVDANVCRRIVDSVDVHAESVVVEIGPGRGALTGFLAEAGPARYVALEKDHDLAARLAEEYSGIEVVDGDALAYDWTALAGPELKIAGNLPYNVASRIIWDVVSCISEYDRAVFMVQHEVARRLCAKSGTKQFGALTAWVQSFAEVDYLFKVPPTVFRPQPKVDSAIIICVPKPVELRPKAPQALDRLLKMCFQKRRKQLKNILKDVLTPELESWMEVRGIALTLRPEALTIEQFVALSEQM